MKKSKLLKTLPPLYWDLLCKKVKTLKNVELNSHVISFPIQLALEKSIRDLCISATVTVKVQCGERRSFIDKD